MTQKRRIPLLCTVAAVGFAVNVLVAWTAAIASPLDQFDKTPPKHALAWWTRHAPEGFIARPHSGVAFTGPGHDVALLNAAEFEPHVFPPGVAFGSFHVTPIRENDLALTRAGFPLRSVMCAEWHGGDGTVLSVGAIRLGQLRMLPMRPLWVGLALNTALYALIAWIVFRGTRFLRHRSRVARGLCVACAYPVQGSRCPECGHPVSP